MERSRSQMADRWFFWLFGLQILIIFAIGIGQSTKPPAVAMGWAVGYAYLTPFFLLLIITYLVYEAALLWRQWKLSDIGTAWSSVFGTTWAKRVNWALGLSIVVNVAYQYYTSVQLSL